MSGVVTRRNIALALGAWKLSKSIRRIFQEPPPEPEPEPPKRRKRKVALVVAGAVAAAGAFVFWRSR